METKIVYAPWTKDQIKYLQKWQEDGAKHPYTCKCGEKLIPAKNGWFCKHCNYTQNWYHNFGQEVGE